MQRIPTLLQKLTELSRPEAQHTVLDLDLMLDYTRVLYADLLDWRSKIVLAPPSLHAKEPTLDELTAALAGTPDEKPPAPAVTASKLPPEGFQPEPVRNGPPPAPPRSPRRPIEEKIGINDKYQFISMLFGNQKEEYELTLQRINGMDSEQEVLQWLEQRHWDPEQDATLSFYNLIEQHFNPFTAG